MKTNIIVSKNVIRKLKLYKKGNRIAIILVRQGNNNYTDGSLFYQISLMVILFVPHKLQQLSIL